MALSTLSCNLKVWFKSIKGD